MRKHSNYLPYHSGYRNLTIYHSCENDYSSLCISFHWCHRPSYIFSNMLGQVIRSLDSAFHRLDKSLSSGYILKKSYVLDTFIQWITLFPLRATDHEDHYNFCHHVLLPLSKPLYHANYFTMNPTMSVTTVIHVSPPMINVTLLNCYAMFPASSSSHRSKRVLQV